MVVAIPTALLLQQRGFNRELRESLRLEKQAREVADRERARAEAEQERAESERERAEQERQRAEEEVRRHTQVSLVLAEMFSVADPDRAQGQVITARDLLDEGVRRVDSQLADQPTTRAYLQVKLGEIYRKSGMNAEARPLLEEAVAVLEEEVGDNPAILADACYELGDLLRVQGENERAEEFLRRSMTLQAEVAGAPGWVGPSRGVGLAALFVGLRQFDEADPLLEEGVAALRADSATPPHILAHALSTRGAASIGRAQYASGGFAPALWQSAERDLREAIEIYDSLGSERSLNYASLVNALGVAAKSQGRLDEAERLYRRALEHMRNVLDDSDLRLAVGLNNLASLLMQKGEHARAVGPLREAIAAFEAQQASDSRLVGMEATLGSLLVQSGEYRQAEEHYAEVLPRMRAEFGDDHLMVAYALCYLATCQLDRGALELAESTARNALATFDRARGEGHPDSQLALRTLGQVLTGQGEYAESIAMFARALSLVEGHPRYGRLEGQVRYRLGLSEFGRDRVAEAEQHLRRAAALFGDVDNRLDEFQVKGLLGRVLMGQGRSEEALPLLEESLRGHGTSFGDGQRACADCCQLLLEHYEQVGRGAEAARMRDLLREISGSR